MKVNHPLALSTALATAINTDAWSMGSSDLDQLFFPHGSLLSPLPFFDSPSLMLARSTLFPTIRTVQRTKNDNESQTSNNQEQSRQERVPLSSYRSSPRYQVIDNNKLFQVSIDVPGVKMDNINVSLEDTANNRMLTISGSRESMVDHHRYTSRFSQSFSLDASVDVEKLSAQLENGVLVVTAPKDMKRLEANVRQIPITASGDATKSIEAPVQVETVDRSEVEAEVADISNNDAVELDTKQDVVMTDTDAHENVVKDSAADDIVDRYMETPESN